VAIPNSDLDPRRLERAQLEEARTRAAAWYFVTYDRGEILRRQGVAQSGLQDFMFHGAAPLLLSFAWIGVDLLASAPSGGS